MKLILMVAIAATMLTLPLRAVAPLYSGIERPVTAERSLVPVHGVGELALISSGGVELAFWWDQRLGGRMFRSVGPFDAPYPSGEPFEPFRGFRPYSAIEIARVGAGFLMVVDGIEDGPAARAGFYALPIDADGEPLADRPTRIWDLPGYDSQMKLLSNGETALLVWSEDYSVRTLQLGADGRLLEWSAPVESLAGTIQRIDATVVGSSYLLVVNAVNPAGGEGVGLFSVPLTSDGDPAAPLTKFALRTEWSFDLAGGADSAFVVWFSGGWRGAVLAPDGRLLHEVAYPALGSDPSAFRPKVARRAAGWTLADTGGASTNEIELVDLDSSGAVAGRRAISFAPGELAGVWRVAENEAPLLVAGTWQPGEQASAIWFVDATEGVPDRRSRMSSMEAQHAAGLEASDTDLLMLWATASDDGFNRLHARLDSRPDTLDFPPDNYGFTPSAASDGERFLLFQFSEPSTVYGRTLAGRWIDRSGGLSEPFTIAAEVFTQPVAAWSGTEFLAYWTRSTRFKLTLTSGEMFVSSIFPSGVAQSSPFVFRWTMQEDALCGKPGCFVIWNDADLTKYCDFCLVPTRLLGAPVLRSGERLSEPIELDGVSREARLAPAGSRIALVDLVPAQELRVRLLDWNGNELARLRVAEVAASPRFSVASLGDDVVVVWEQDGDLMGRMVTAGGELGEIFPVANGPEEEVRPFLAVRGDTVTVVYDRLTPEAGWVPRVYVRELSVAPIRRRGVRP